MLETPSNPLLQVADIRRLAEIAHDAGALLAVDNTIATPINQQPLALGADFTIHATTKYIGGHSDILGGMIVTRAENDLWKQIVFLQKVGGAVPSPFECWLALRGIQTLPYRAKAHSRNAMAIAQFLESHPAVEKVLYPGLESHVGHEVAVRQMDGFGGVLSFLMKGGQSAAMAVAAKVQIFTRATSFGGTHSLIEHRASVEAPDTKTPVNLLRCSIGLEHPDDLIDDLRQALGD
jgi:cystathionine gamma-synthase